MSGDPDPMDPEAWLQVPNVCGSCIAWRREEAKPGDEVATGGCKLRPEMGRVPADLPKCNKYMGRGQFKYQPGKGPQAPKRRSPKTISIVRHTAEGERVETKASIKEAPLERMQDGPREARPPSVKEISLGEITSAEVARWAIAELLRQEYGRSNRELHPKFKQGKVIAERSDGKRVEITSERFFSKIDRLKTSLANMEKALDSQGPGLGNDLGELKSLLQRMQGSFTTFNVMFADREDYFSSKE